MASLPQGCKYDYGCASMDMGKPRDQKTILEGCKAPCMLVQTLYIQQFKYNNFLTFTILKKILIHVFSYSQQQSCFWEIHN